MKVILAITLLLSACGPKIMQPIDVKVPVALPCGAQAIAEPDWYIAKLAREATALEKLKAAFSDLELSKAYIIRLQAELEGCR